MRILVDRLKPYWKQLLLIIFVHIIQAVAILSLPAYTSSMVDTGIANQGFQYAAPLMLNREDARALEALMTGEELGAFEETYELVGATYRIKDEIYEDKDRMEDLQAVLVEPVAAYGEYKGLDETSQAQTKDLILASPDKGQARLKALPLLENYSQEMTQSLAIQTSISLYENAGQDPSQIQRSYLFTNGAKMLGIALVAFLAATTAHFVSAHVGTGFGRELRNEVFDKVINFSNNELSRFSTASLITRTTNDIQQILFLLTTFLRAGLLTPITMIIGIALILGARADMAWILLAGLVALIVVIIILFSLVIPTMQDIPRRLDELNLVARENLTGVQVIRAFGRQRYEEDRFDEANTNMAKTYLFIDRTMALMTPIMIFIADLLGCAIIWFGGQKMAMGTMQVGEMMSLTAYMMRVFFSFLNVTMMSTMLPRTLVCLKRVQEVLETGESISDPKDPVAMGKEEVEGLVNFDQVSFQFPNADEPVLENINFTAYPGQTTAIIGSTGSGKSTILNLIMRFIDVSSGQVTIDGLDVRDMSQKNLRELIGYVPQRGVLFSGTIASNIGYGVDELSQEDMVKAAEIAHADDFIESKKNDYNSRIAQGGSNVSGGQKQRLSIARAIAKKPKIYLFDDSFSALDYRTDKSLRQALRDNVGDATVIIVAQRISTILDADNIIVLNDVGQIEAQGTHEDLMESSEIYQEIAVSQLSEDELAGGEGSDR